MSTPQVEDNGLLFVYGESGPFVTENELDDWYDKEQIPSQLSDPSISSAQQYRAADEKPPSWLTIYNAKSPETIEVNVQNSPANDLIVSRLAVLDQRIYKRLVTFQNPNFTDPTSLPIKYTAIVGVVPRSPEQEEEIRQWYLDEHLDMLAKVPGYIRARQYKLVSNSQAAGNVDIASTAVVLPLITLYDLDNGAFEGTPEFQEAINTPWCLKILSEVEVFEQRLFKVKTSYVK